MLLQLILISWRCFCQRWRWPQRPRQRGEPGGVHHTAVLRKVSQSSSAVAKAQPGASCTGPSTGFGGSLSPQHREGLQKRVGMDGNSLTRTALEQSGPRPREAPTWQKSFHLVILKQMLLMLMILQYCGQYPILWRNFFSYMFAYATTQQDWFFFFNKQVSKFN